MIGAVSLICNWKKIKEWEMHPLVIEPQYLFHTRVANKVID
ncbi:hypothetical protein [Clostridium botulinum]|nr:hypothetical protein [Clostridium botulinum]